MKSFRIFNFSLRVFSLVLMLFLFQDCKNSNTVGQLLPTGESTLAVPGGNIWYKITGSGDGIPLVLLHGGPGSSSFCLKPFEEIGNERQVIRYDQLGAGKSDKISDTSMFTLDHFVQELELLREHLGIKKWHIMGHSYGTILAVEYYKIYPERVASLSLAGAALNLPMWQENARKLIGSLPAPMQEAVQQAEATGNFNDSLYQAAMNQFTSSFVVHKPVMADMDSTISTYNWDIYMYMQGSSEFNITGTLKDYDATPFLPQIKVPTLFTVGETDEAGPDLVKSFADLVPGSKYAVIPGAAHITMWDAPEETIRIHREFLNEADSK